MKETPQVDEARKVIGIFTRQPVEFAPPVIDEEGDPLPPQEIDTDTLQVLDKFRELTQLGRFNGVLVIAWDKQRECFCSEVLLPPDDAPANSACKFMGYMEFVKTELLEVVEADTDHGDVE
jgi:hypothetical protein